jgi:hypothetical protein
MMIKHIVMAGAAAMACGMGILPPVHAAAPAVN